MTHASAFQHHDGYELAAAVDPDRQQRERFERKFDRPAYADLRELLGRHRPEVVSIGVPTDRHFETFQGVIAAQPLAILCEKPIAARCEDARGMLSLAEKHDCVLAINYPRRFEPGVLELKRAIEAQECGGIYKGVVWYSQGLLNTGSHYIDLLRFLLGEASAIAIIDKGRDWSRADPEPDVCIRFADCRVCFLAAREECFARGDMTLIGTDGVIRYAEGGAKIEILKAKPDPRHHVTTVLWQKRTIPTEWGRYQWHVMDGLYRHLIEKRPLSSDGGSAMANLDVVERIFERLRGCCDE